jgi:hypothetical protein
MQGPLQLQLHGRVAVPTDANEQGQAAAHLASIASSCDPSSAAVLAAGKLTAAQAVSLTKALQGLPWQAGAMGPLLTGAQDDDADHLQLGVLQQHVTK